MKYTGFSKFIPITEEQYRDFKEHQNNEAKIAEQELTRPAEMLPLVAAQNEKTRTLFTQSNSPELQEQQLAHLTTIINDLRQKVVSQQEKTITPPLSDPIKLFSGNRQKNAESLLSALGDDIWNEKGELVAGGSAIPNSSKEELMNFLGSNWRTKYLDNEPVGAAKLVDLVKRKNIKPKLVGVKLRRKLQNVPAVKQSTPSQIKGFASVGKRQRSPEEVGWEILNQDKKFRKFLSN